MHFLSHQMSLHLYDLLTANTTLRTTNNAHSTIRHCKTNYNYSIPKSWRVETESFLNDIVQVGELLGSCVQARVLTDRGGKEAAGIHIVG